MSEESTEMRQENEMKALEAIFNEELKDLRKPIAWNTWQPLNLVLSLNPQQGNSGYQEAYVIVDLHIICSVNYPNEVPEILLENSRGMSDTILMQLKRELAVKAEELKGEVMIFELAQYVQEFLHIHNKPGPKSFYDEMLHRKKQQEQLKEQERRRAIDIERQMMVSEMQRVQDIIKSELKLRKEHRKSISAENSSENNLSQNSASEISDEQCQCSHKGTKIICLNNGSEIQRGQCLDHEKYSVNFIGLNITTGELVIISEWLFTTDSIVSRQIASIEQEFNYLIKLKHPNLSHYISMSQEYEAGNLRILIAKEMEVGISCSSLFISENIFGDGDLLRHIIEGVLNAVDFLHKNNIIHRDITPSCVFVTRNGMIKLSNYSIHKRLSDLSQAMQNSTSCTKKTDILNLGLFIKRLIQGHQQQQNDFNVISKQLQDFLDKCLAKDEKDRYSAAQLLRHPYLKSPNITFSTHKILAEGYDKFTTSEIEIPNEIDQKADLVQNLHSNVVSGQSRMQNDFEILQWLGKGAFGDVLKVRNKLDGGCYAIKRIELNPKNKQLNRKITREVKLLSRLNHENVVRYYNSWIESAIIENESTSSSLSQSLSSSLQTPNTQNKVVTPVCKRKDLITAFENIELLAPPIRDVEWSISYSSKKAKSINNFEEDDDDEDEEEDDSSSEEESWNNFNPEKDKSSDGIEFENSSETSEIQSASKIDELSTLSSKTKLIDSELKNINIREIQFMYIQMEFCEKSTLRTAIDNGLYSDTDRIWRLFREIVEGLAHIHQQGMIHRDLKPVNIFLDSNDHVKIGDFGLATTNVLSTSKIQSDNIILNRSIQENDKDTDYGAGDSLTGQVGTALYVAPELSATTKAIYNQKVDIYSLGIILFEMSYRPLTTGMERIKLLRDLRTKDIKFPDDFETKSKQEILIRWLLDHDVSSRPTSQELLQSELIPPPILEEAELRELVRHTLSNPQRKAYKYLIGSCFAQPLRRDQDIAFDVGCMSVPNFKTIHIVEFVKKTVIKIFKLHGGQCLNTPLLMPKNKYYEGVESCVRIMTHSGNIVSLPYDLRIPFARYVARNNITLLRRYSIDRVYREKKPFGFYPRELYECAFDIVTPSPGNFMADAELLLIAYEIIKQFATLSQKNILIRLNHHLILKGILLHCGIKEEKHIDVYNILSDAREGKVSKFQVKTHLGSLCLSENAMLTLFNLIENETDFSKMSSMLQIITKRKNSEASELVKQGLVELKTIIKNAEALCVQCNIVISPGLVFNIQQQYSGMICQFACELKKKRRRCFGLDVVAAGGRYDSLISTYRQSLENMGLLRDHPVVQCAVGISLSLDKLVQTLLQEEDIESVDTENRGLKCVVCFLGSRSLIKDRLKLLRDLWASGICATLLEAQTIEEIQEQSSELHVSHVIIIKDNEQSIARIYSRGRDRFQESKKVNTSELVECMQKIIKQSNDVTCEYISSNNSGSISKSEQKLTDHNHDPDVSIIFVTIEKLSANARKRYDNQIKSLMDKSLKYFSSDVRIVVLALSVDSNIIKTLISTLNFDSEAQFQNTVSVVIEKHPRHKKYLTEICDEISELHNDKNHPIIALFSLPDAMYKFFI